MRFQRGMDSYRQADYRGAVNELRAAADQDPDAAHIRFYLGISQLMLGQDNAAIDSLAKGMATRNPVQSTFADDYSKEGVSYTVQKGDTLAVIAKKTGAKAHDIINANKISDPSRINAGQTLFIPGGK